MKIKKIINDYPKGKDFYIYAETAFIHDGDYNYLTNLIDAAAKSKSDGIKFQILIENENANTKNLENFNDIYKWIFSEKQWLNIIKKAKQKNLEVTVLPIDVKAARFCKENKKYIDALEIHSACFNDYFLLKEIIEIPNMPIILGIGGRTIEDIDYALKILKGNNNIILMYGFQSFPTKIEDINLSKIKKYIDQYNLPIGYADHTRFDDEFGDSMVEYAYTMGARVFEKHITLEKGKKRVDYDSAVDYRDILNLRKKLDKIVKVLGNDSFDLNDAEKSYRNREKQLVFVREINAGEIIDYSHLGFKVSTITSDFEQKDINKVVGRKASKDMQVDDVVKERDLVK